MSDFFNPAFDIGANGIALPLGIQPQGILALGGVSRRLNLVTQVADLFISADYLGAKGGPSRARLQGSCRASARRFFAAGTSLELDPGAVAVIARFFAGRAPGDRHRIADVPSVF